ncbi:MAG TPA: phosphatase PAP2 family protein [Caldithrix sp.]|nr:phosphatase PAP2 family protein [Calditrichaceae bacterium]HEM49352.1 phosphatase PAP2 family protein [Caldithrix sp.]
MIRAFGSTIQRFDILLILIISQLNRRYVIDKAFFLITRLGDGPLYVIAGILLIATPVQDGFKIVYIAILAYAIELPIYFVVKKYVKRLRPFEKMQNINHLIAPPDKYSFPSGHTAAAFVMAIVFSNHFSVLSPGLYILAGLIGISRVYLRVHYPTDIVAGAVLGIISANTSLWILG